MKRLYLSLLVIIAVTLSSVVVVHAQSSERITSFVSDVEIDASATATRTETIQYDFGFSERHGIFRDIPIQYVVEGDRGYALSFDILSVSRDSEREPYEEQDISPSYVRLKVGDPDAVISGSHTYTIRYAIGPVAIAADDDTEIVRIDVPGSSWEVPIDRVVVNVDSPFAAIDQTCYEGTEGSTEQGCRLSDVGTFISSRALAPGETITTESVFASGTFSRLAEETTLELDYATPIWIPIAIFSTITTIIGFFGGSTLIGYIRHRRRKKEEISYPRYEPPEGLGPAELGLLIDNSASGAELTATFINLAVSGNMKIVQTKEKKWYAQAEYEFQKLVPAQDKIREYEKKLLGEIFNGGKNTTSTKELSKSQGFIKANLEFQKTLKKNLKEMGFYKKVSVFSPTLASRMSDAGYTKWAEVEGFREFLQLTEKARLEMLEAPKMKPEHFSEYLPYAIALGVEKQWAKQFEHLDINTDDWYQGRGSGFNSVLLATSLSSGLGSVAASASRSSGSSGSGGGFSGGGFSGGGGGSW